MKNVMVRPINVVILLFLMSGKAILAQDLQSAIKLTRSEQFRKADLAVFRKPFFI